MQPASPTPTRPTSTTQGKILRLMSHLRICRSLYLLGRMTRRLHSRARELTAQPSQARYLTTLIPADILGSLTPTACWQGQKEGRENSFEFREPSGCGGPGTAVRPLCGSPAPRSSPASSRRPSGTTTSRMPPWPTRRIRAAPGIQVLLVAVTPYGDKQDRRRSSEAGFDAIS